VGALWSGVHDGQRGRVLAASAGEVVTQPLDFVVLGGEPGQGLLTEAGQLGDQGVLSGEAPSEGVVAVLEAGDLGVARVGAAVCVAERGQAAVELVG
jgi:hypothetical protein